jgi:hypothetical protein
MNYPVFIVSENDLGEHLILNKKNILYFVYQFIVLWAKIRLKKLKISLSSSWKLEAKFVWYEPKLSLLNNIYGTFKM